MKKLLITLFAIMMATVSYAEDVTEETLRFVPGIWATDNAKFAAWVWGDNVEGAWTPFFTGEGDTLSTTINAQATSVIFVRLSSSATEPSWDENSMWNKTGDLTIDHQSLLFVITDWESGEWVTTAGNYYLIGNAEQLGSWNTENALPMENGYISLELPAGKYAFQVLPEDKNWNTALKYAAVNTRCSSLGLKTDADENIWFTLEEAGSVTISVQNEKLCISGAIKDFSDEVYSNYAFIVNHERIYGCAYAGNSGNWPQYSARVQLNVGDTIRLIDRMMSNYEMQVPSDEYGENDKFDIFMYGEYRVCKVAGCYDIYYKTNGYLYITSADNCSEGVAYDGLYIPYANVNITVTNEYENAQGFVEVNGTGIGNSGGVSASYVMGSHLTLEAYPNENFQFLQWSDGALENPRNLIVTGDTTIHADMGNLAYYPTGILLNHNRFIRSTYNDGVQLIVRANIQQGDKVELYFINDNIYWMAEVEPYGLYENFSGSAEQGYLICNVSGCYDIYFKMVDGITQSIYIGQGTVCNDGVPWTDPNIGYVFSVVGTENLFGTAWDLADTLTNMTQVGDGRYEYTLDSVTLTPEGDYQYKVIANHMWNVKEYPSVQEDDNYHIMVEDAGVYSVLFSLDTIAGCTHTTTYLHAIIDDGCPIASGSCGADGDNLTWVLGCDSVLTISGEGAMPSSYSANATPWYQYGQAIKHINIEEGVTKLALNAFYNSGTSANYPNVRTLSIPSTLGAPIENSYFYGCKFTSVTLNSDTIVGKASYTSGSSLQNKFGAQVEQYIIGGSVRSIANFAFRNQDNDSLRSIILPEGLEAIGNWAFGYIEHLTSISIPSTVQTIGTDAFAGCTNLRSVELSEGLMTINGQAFWMCDSLTRVTCNALTPPTLNQTAFDHNQNDTLFVPCEAKTAYQEAEYWKNFSKILCADDTIGGNTEPDVPEVYTFTLDSAWQFIMLPTVFGLTQEDIGVDGEIEWGIYNSGQRATGRTGWQGFVPQSGFSASLSYIVRARNGSATLTIHIPEQARQQAAAAIPINYYAASLPQNANWNFLGNPYPFNYDILSALESADIESPIAVWNGTGYTTYTPGIDSYVLEPFKAFFIQLPDGGSQALPFSPEYIRQ